jgi:hypothetical protein
MLVRFSNVGRNKKTWDAEIPCENGVLDGVAMLKSIRKSGALMSRSVDIDDVGNIVVGGYRVVGRWDAIEGLRPVVEGTDP